MSQELQTDSVPGPNAREGNGSPCVTVVVPTYNRADLIPETLLSIEVQTFRDWECVVVDDGSTDHTSAVVAEFRARDPRFRYVRQENSGVCAARNRGIHSARGRFIAFIDSDDQFAPDRLAWQVEVLESDPEVVLVYGDTWQYHTGDREGGFLYLADLAEKPNGWAFESLLQQCSIYAPLVRAESIREVGGFDASIPYAEDWDAWIGLARIGKLAYAPRISTYYRLHEGNRSGAAYREYSCAWRVVRKHTDMLPAEKRIALARAARSYFRQGYTGRLLHDSIRLARDGDWYTAARAGWALLALSSTGPGVLLRNLVWTLRGAVSARLRRVRGQRPRAGSVAGRAGGKAR